MAKSNSFFGLRRGSTKSHTYQVLKGQQITKDRVSYVSNPRSDAQMTQRSQFLSAVRFYQRSNQRFFRFAFENKRQRESEYNAFMRLNANLGGYITKAQGDAVGFPMVAPWILAQGSMAPIAQSMVDNSELERSYLNIVVSPVFSDAAPTTIGGVSAAFKASYPDIAEGDIITLVDISYTEAGNAFVEDFDAKDVTGTNLWRVQQFFINSNDDRAISDVLRDVTCEVVGGALVLVLGVAASDTIGGAACVLTRNTKSGLKVATTALALNVTAVNVYELMRSNSHREQVLAWWGSQQMAILQGSIANEQGGEPASKVFPVFEFATGDEEKSVNVEGFTIPTLGIGSAAMVNLTSSQGSGSVALINRGAENTLMGSGEGSLEWFDAIWLDRISETEVKLRFNAELESDVTAEVVSLATGSKVIFP